MCVGGPSYSLRKGPVGCISPSPSRIWFLAHIAKQSPTISVLFDNIRHMQNFISQTFESCYYRLRRISSIQKYLSIEAAVILVTSTHSVTPRPRQFSPFWSTGLLLLSIAFVAYKTVLFASYWTRTHVKLTIIFLPFQFPHWLPTLQRIQYKIITICYKCTTCSECSVVSLWFSSTLHIRPPILSALLLIL